VNWERFIEEYNEATRGGIVAELGLQLRDVLGTLQHMP